MRRKNEIRIGSYHPDTLYYQTLCDHNNKQLKYISSSLEKANLDSKRTLYHTNHDHSLCSFPSSGTYVLLVGILLSYVPQILGFILYVIPSSAYKKEFEERSMAKKIFESMVKTNLEKTMPYRLDINELFNRNQRGRLKQFVCFECCSVLVPIHHLLVDWSFARH